MVCRNSAMRQRLLKVLGDEREQHRVHPLALLEVRAPLHALSHVPGRLGVRDRAIVEAVALELDAVEAELAEDEPLERLCTLDPDPPAAEARIDREPAGFDDPVLLADLLE